MTDIIFGKEYIVKVTDDGECVTTREMIRCKDCVWHGTNTCRENIARLKVLDDDYCSYAERKEE